MLEIQELSRRFDGGTRALDRVDLAVAESEIVGLRFVVATELQKQEAEALAGEIAELS